MSSLVQGTVFAKYSRVGVRFMKTSLVRVSKVLMMASFAVWATACSDVNFTPTDNLSAFELPDGSQKESFSFDDDGSLPKVDVLFVVDNSRSMVAEQKKLGAALASFIGSLGNVDWQIGITTTDISDGPYGLKGSLLAYSGGSKVLSVNTPNYPKEFAQTVVRNETLSCNPEAGIVCPSADERPLEAVRMAISKHKDENSGLFRSGADLAVVMLTDEDEGSDLTNAITSQAVIEAFATTFGTSKTLSTYGIIVQPGDTACYDEQLLTNGAQYGTRAAELAALTGGVTGSICDEDYSPILSSIGDRVRDMVKSVTLKYTPLPETVQLFVRPSDPSLTWQINGNTIVFNKPPNNGTKIDVVYRPASR